MHQAGFQVMVNVVILKVSNFICINQLYVSDYNIPSWNKCFFLLIHKCSNLACKCNSLGSTRNDDRPCFGKCCNDDGSCKCKIGYTGSQCNECDNGYYATNITDGEKSCSGTATFKVKSY